MYIVVVSYILLLANIIHINNEAFSPLFTYCEYMLLSMHQFYDNHKEISSSSCWIYAEFQLNRNKNWQMKYDNAYLEYGLAISIGFYVVVEGALPKK